jgi:hypothetical protein
MYIITNSKVKNELKGRALHKGEVHFILIQKGRNLMTKKNRGNRGPQHGGQQVRQEEDVNVLTLKSVTDILDAAKTRFVVRARGKVALPSEIARLERDANHYVPHLKLSLFRKDDGEMMVRVHEAVGKRYDLLKGDRYGTRGEFAWAHIESAIDKGISSAIENIDAEDVDEFCVLVVYLREILAAEDSISMQKKVDEPCSLKAPVADLARHEGTTEAAVA